MFVDYLSQRRKVRVVRDHKGGTGVRFAFVVRVVRDHKGGTGEHFKVTGIEHCFNKPDSHRLNRKNYWQHQLRTFTPLGLNIKNQLPHKF